LVEQRAELTSCTFSTTYASLVEVGFEDAPGAFVLDPGPEPEAVLFGELLVDGVELRCDLGVKI
jgi:hypothetical protein